MPQWRLRATTRGTPPASAITPAPAAIEATEPVLASVGLEAAGVPAGAFMLRMPPRAETGAGPLPVEIWPRVVTPVVPTGPEAAPAPP